jgi:hypothetical protein
VEKLMGAARDIDCYSKSLSSPSFNKVTADLPCSRFIEICKLQFLLFLEQLPQQVIHDTIL